MGTKCINSGHFCSQVRIMNFPFCTVFDNHTKSRILRPRFFLFFFLYKSTAEWVNFGKSKRKTEKFEYLKKAHRYCKKKNETFWMILNSEILTQKHFWILRLAINFLSKFK